MTGRRRLYIVVTIMIMLIVSRFAVRIVDAPVQIDGNVLALVLFLIVINTVIVLISRRLYRRGRSS